jgi:hypothetical protein
MMQFLKTTVPPFTQLFSHGLNSTEPLWSVLETGLRDRFPPPTALKQLENVIREEWYKIPLETVQSCKESTPRIAAVLKAKGGRASY